MIELIELNKVYKMDNLELLNQLPNNYIDLIYCDILFNTGRKFKDYNDNLGTSQQAIEWYKPRILEMHRVLKEEGSIYIQCDYHLSHYIKILLDEIFNIKNFRNEIIWHYNRWTASSKDFQRLHDTIYRYSKTNKFIFNVEYKDYTEGSKKRKEHTLHRFKDGEKYLVTENKGVAQNDVWCDIPFIPPSAKERLGYDTQKPTKLLERIIKCSSNEGNIVADFFMGSGTTGEVALELSRKFIGCDIEEKACEISKSRIEKIIEAIDKI